MKDDFLLYKLLLCIQNEESIPEELEHKYFEAKHNRVLKFNKKTNTYILSDFGEFVLGEMKSYFNK